MPNDCLMPGEVQAFRKALKEKEITMDDLLNMPTEALIKTFEPYAGKNAPRIALLFEQKRILKNRVLGLQNAASKLGELGRYSPEKKAQIAEELAAFKKAQLERIFNPKEGETFYNALADKIMGSHVTREEAKTVFEMQATSDRFKESYNAKTEKWENPEAKLAYGMQQNALRVYTESLKGNEAPLKALLQDRYAEFKQQWKENKGVAVGTVLADSLATTRDTAVAMLSSFDNSFQGRQGFNALINHPEVWKEGFVNSWKDGLETMKGNDAAVKAALWADIFSDPDYMAGRMKGLLGGAEEAFPTSLPGRIPKVGNIFKASENMYNGSALRVRVGLFKKFLDLQEQMGADRSDPTVIKGAEGLALQLTSRSKLGKKGATLLNHYLLWAPRMLKSSWDTLAKPFDPSITPFERKEYSLNLLRFVVAAAAIRTVAAAAAKVTGTPNPVTLDPRSSDFRNLRFGNTRFAFGTNELALITLASRIALTTHNGEWGQWSVDQHGVYHKSENAVGKNSPMDFVLRFLEGKAAPFPTKVILDMLNQRMQSGKKPTVLREVGALFTPIPLQNLIQLADDHSAAAVFGVLTDVPGVSSNTYTDDIAWDESNTKEMQQFKKKVGTDGLEKATKEFNDKWNTWFAKASQNPKYKDASDEDKEAQIKKKRAEIKEHVFRKYGFIYKPERKKPLPKLN